MVTHAIRNVIGLALVFVAFGCGEAPVTEREKAGGSASSDSYYVSLGLEDGEGLSLVAQAFSGYVLSLVGGEDCWGPQATTFDSVSASPLVVRKGAAGCSVNVLKLRFKEGNVELLATSTEAAGLPATPGSKGSFVAGNQRAFEVKVTKGVVTSADSIVLLSGRELKVEATARKIIKSCFAPWGVEVAHEGSIVGFQAKTVPYGSQCVSKNLKCLDGVLADAALYPFPSCAEPTLVSVTLSSDKAEVLVGATAQMTVKAKFSDGSVVSVTPQSYTAQPANLVQISAAGLLKGVADGALTVTAKFDGMNSNALALSVYKLVNETVVVGDGVYNQKLGFTGHFGGGVGLDNDATSATKACIAMGYLTGSMGAVDNYVPPYNETLYFWNGTGFSFKQSKGSDRDHVINLNCVRQCKISGATKTCTPS